MWRRRRLAITVAAALAGLAAGYLFWGWQRQRAPDAPPPAAAVEMNQQDCMYTPRLTTAVVGQKIVARNGDPVLHNVHAYLGASTLFNKSMPNQRAAPIEYPYDGTER